MIPRKTLDIGWRDLAFGIAACLRPLDRAAAQAQLERLWSPADDALACLSVRSGFDLLLQQLALPPGSEILVSAITIRDMVSIIEQHGLIAVPVDIDPASGAVSAATLERAITGNTRAVLIAHLFGSRMPMDELVAVTQRHRLYLFEDCAQAYAGDGYRGNAGSDAVLFSFGTIKTATAAGGALLILRDPQQLAALAQRQALQPVQPGLTFLRKLLKVAALKALSCRLPYTLFTALCRALGVSHDAVISGAVRGFPGSELLRQLRRQPSAALLSLLTRRLRDDQPARLAARKAAAEALLAHLPAGCRVCHAAPFHSHWVLPVRSRDPDRLVAHLLAHGIDATRGASSLYAVPATPQGQDAPAAQRLMAQVVYLPFDTCRSEDELHAIAAAVSAFESAPPAA